MPHPATPSSAFPELAPRWAAAAPALCALHCLASPLLIVVAPALAPTAAVERAMFVVSALLAGTMEVRALRRGATAAPLMVVAIGIGIWGASLSIGVGSLPERATTVLGAALVAAGLV
jgi:hypothetical protein